MQPEQLQRQQQSAETDATSEEYEFITFSTPADLENLIDSRSDLYSENEIQNLRSSSPDGLSQTHGQEKKTFSDFFDLTLQYVGKLCFIAYRYAAAHNPLYASGRKQIKATLKASGPAYRPTGPSTDSQHLENHFTGWKMGTLLSAIVLGLCLLVEVIMLTAAVSVDGRESGDHAKRYDGVILEGSCSTVKKYNTLLSLPINIIATLLIGISNYTMQCLSAPSERELRRAHKHGQTLHLGVSSPSNIRYLDTVKTVLWYIMGLSSIPVHLLLNSAFFASLQTNDYGLMVVSSDFNQTSVWSNCTHQPDKDNLQWTDLACDIFTQATAANSNYERLSNEDCIKRYSNQIVNQFSNVVLVSSLSSSDRSSQSLVAPNNSFSNNLAFTAKHTYRKAAPGFERELLDLPALLGIFTTLDYKSWQKGAGTYQWFRRHALLDIFTAINLTYLSKYTLANDVPALDKYFANGTSTTLSFDPTSWMCDTGSSPVCSESIALHNADHWTITPEAIPIDFCLSERIDNEVCKLQYSTVILSVIIGCDIVKILVVLFMLTRIQDAPCVTIGDALAAFLTDPEPSTRSRCLLDQEGVSKGAAGWFTSHWIHHNLAFGQLSVPQVWKGVLGPKVLKWAPSKRRLYHGPSRSRWVSFMCLMSSLLAGSAVLLGLALNSSNSSNIWTGGFRSADPNAIFQWTSSGTTDPDASFLVQVLLINLPQLLFSFLYFTYNGLFSVMHGVVEWAGLAKERKPLRVSNPGKGQRSTYWLNLPWAYSLPLLILSTLIHWLLSRSLYLVKINVIGPDGQPQPRWNISACGFSPLAMLLIIIILVIMVGFLVFRSFLRLDAPIPMVGTASAAISAACHHPNDNATEANKPLQWGVTSRPADGKPGHCALSSGEVEEPVPGQLYS